MPKWHFYPYGCFNLKITRDKIEKLGMRRTPHLSYSPDIEMCDFWLFRKLKRNLQGCHFSNENQLFDKVVDFFQKIDKNEIKKSTKNGLQSYIW